MPKLDTNLHLNMLEEGKRLRKGHNTTKDNVYGMEWGNPQTVEPLVYVKEKFLIPYLSSNTSVLEIGPGGGRWTQYMLETKHIYVVDYHQEILDELKSNFDMPNMTFINNNGNDFPDIPEKSIDLLFSFGVFVHLDIDIIDNYLKNIKPLLHKKSNVIIHYSDKTKPMAKRNRSFSDNNPDKMRKLVLSHGYSIYEEDLGTMWHSSIIRFGISKNID